MLEEAKEYDALGYKGILEAKLRELMTQGESVKGKNGDSEAENQAPQQSASVVGECVRTDKRAMREERKEEVKTQDVSRVEVRNGVINRK